MMRRFSRFPTTRRRGITLTEILISIMILAVGLVSLATLFPIGLLRLREAQRASRTAILSASTNADLLGRGILDVTTFIDPGISPWYSATHGDVPNSYDPWIQDTPAPFGDWTEGGAYRGYGGMGGGLNPFLDTNQATVNGLNPIPGSGLPVAYDPLWWYQQGTQPYSAIGVEAEIQSRFGSGVALGMASAHGLQRLTNFPVFPRDGAVNRYAENMILSTFVSPEDILWQDSKNAGYFDFFNPTLSATSLGVVSAPSPVVPDLTTAALTRIDAGATGAPADYAAVTNDWRYTWMFTGQRASAFNDKVLNGDVVIFENRPFGFETLTNQISGDTITQVAGERVLRAIFGYGRNIVGGAATGYAVGSDNSVLLLWPNGYPDPEIRPGGWIADVTYERSLAGVDNNFNLGPGSPPAQRCHWYQVRRATPPADSPDFPGWRYTSIQTTQKLQAKTVLNDGGSPVHDNAALVSPHVIGVVPKTLSIP